MSTIYLPSNKSFKGYGKFFRVFLSLFFILLFSGSNAFSLSTIRGTVRGAGASVLQAIVQFHTGSYGGAIVNSTTVTDTTGTYDFTWSGASNNTTYYVTVAFDGFIFNQATVTTGNNNSNTTQNFTTTTNQSITGTITAGGANLSGVLVTISKGGTGTVWTATTNASGVYSISVPNNTGTNYTETPTLTNYAFSPGPRTFTLTATRTGDNYTAQGGTVSGTVTQNGTGAFVSGVTITIRNSSNTILGTTTTNASGFYSIFVPVGTNHTVTPTLTNYTFTPTVTTLTVADGGTYATTNFTENGNLLTGNVKQNVTNTNIAGVTINITGSLTTTTTTDGSGNYSIFLPIGTYTATPVLTGYTFNPTNYTGIGISNASGAVRNFVINGGVITGTITGSGGVALSGATVTATGGYSTTTNALGVYTLFIPTGTSTSVTVTPSFGSYNFSPSSVSVTVTNGGTSTQNFSGSNCGRIWGYVTVGGNVAQYFPVHLTGYQNRTVLTDVTGFYEFTDLPAPNVCGGGNVNSVNYVVSVQPHVTSTTGTNDLYQTVALGATDGINQEHDFNPNSLDNSTFDLSGNVRAIIGSTLQNQDGAVVTLQVNMITDAPHTNAWTTVGTQTTSGGTGNFSFTSLTGRFQYRLIVSKPGYFYEPTDDTHRVLDQGYIYYIDIPGPRPDQNFIGTPKTYKISGNVKAEVLPGDGATTNINNVLITLYSGPSSTGPWTVINTQLTDPTGNYSFDAQVGGNYKTTASLAGYNFLPANSTIWTNLSSNQSQDFSGTLVPYNLTGSVLNLLASAPMNHRATVQLFELPNITTPKTTVFTTIGSTSYDFGATKLYVNKQYLVSVAPFTGYTFTPAEVDINNPTSNQEADFVAIRTNFTIKGFVNGVDYTHNPNLTGEKVKLTCPGSVENEVFVKGDGTEEYTFTVLAFGTYTVTPSMDGHNFVYKTTTNPNETYTNLSGSLTAENYTASIKTFTISGSVVDDHGNGVSGVTLVITNIGNIPGPNIPAMSPPVVTGPDGSYSYTVNARQDFVITPSKGGVTIVPASASLTDLKDNTVQFFFTTVLKTWKVTGYVTKNTTAGVAVPGATITITRHNVTATWAVTVSGDDGKYEFLGVQGESYDVTGGKNGFNVSSTPTPVVVPALSADYTIPTDQNIVATAIRNNLSGTVSGLGIGENATVSLQVDRSITTTPDWHVVAFLTANGAFTFYSAVEVDSNYRVIATAPGYTIYPPDGRIYSNPSSPITNANFNVATDVQTIKGQVTGVSSGNMPVTIKCVVRSGGTGTVITPIVVTDGSGYYTLTVSANGNYTVTPSRLGYDFTPTSSDVDVVTSAIDNVNFAGILRTHTISGTVSGFGTHGPAQIDITPAPVTGNAHQNIALNGTYTCTLDEITNYTIAATLPGFSFTPPQRIYVNNTADHIDHNFTAIINKINISGTVTLGGNPLQGAVVSCTSNGIAQTNQLTDASGNYGFTVDAFSNNSLSANLPGYSFTPSSSDPNYTNNITSDKTLDFTASRTTNGIITGTIYSNGVPLGGAVVTLGGYSSGSLTTDGTGVYTFSSLVEHENYTVNVTKSGFTFVPAPPVSINNIVGTVTQDFASNRSNYTISGFIRTSTGTAIEDVILRLNGHDTTTVTNSSGQYSITITAGGSYTLSAEKTGFVFAWSAGYSGDPVSTTTGLTAANVQSNQVINLTASNDLSGASITGTVYTGSNPFPGITVNLYKGVGSATIFTTTPSGPDGVYSFNNLEANVTYRVEPVPAGTAFTPVDRTIDNLVGAATGLDFVTGIETKTVTGRITKEYSPFDGVAGIPVAFRTVIQGTGAPNFSSTTVTQSDGSYSVDVPVGSTYMIVPRTDSTKPAVTDHGYTFFAGNQTGGDSSLTPAISSIGTFIYNFTAREKIYTISGNINLNSLNQTGVTVRLDSGVTVGYKNFISNASGYTFTVTGKHNYKVYPISTLYNYDPSERDYTDLIGDKPGQNFDATTLSIKKYIISGKVTVGSSGGAALSNVILSINTAPSQSVSTNASGIYTFTVNAGSNYSITPSTTSGAGVGYTFAPSPVTTASPVTADITTGMDIIATAVGSLSITGTVYNGGAKMQGITLTLRTNNGSDVTTNTDANGQYTFSPLTAHNKYEVFINQGGFSFIPPYIDITAPVDTTTFGYKLFSDFVSSQVQDFATNVNTKTITGNIHTSASGVGNVTVNINSPSFNTSSITSAVTGTLGNFTATVPSGAEYILTPVNVPDIGYSFANTDTVSRTTRYTGIVSADVPGMNFLATVKNYSITVNVANVNSGDTTNLPDLGTGAVRILGVGQHIYTVSGLANYTITPASNQWNFNPSTVTYANLIGDKTITFTASGKKQYTINGNVIRHLDGPLNGVVLTISPGSQVVSTDAFGNYSFIVDAGLSYTITPSTTTGTGVGYTFNTTTPQPIGPVMTNVNNVNFTATPVGGLSISGTVYNNGATLIDAVVTLKVDGTIYGTPINTLADGKYQFTGLLAHSKYEVVVQKSGFAFIPQYIDDGNSPDSTGYGYKMFGDMIVSQVQDFASNTSNATISGNISSLVPLGIQNVPVRITSSGFNTNAITDESGNYTALAPVGLDYTITPIDNPDQGYHYRSTSNPTQNYRQTGYLGGNLPSQNFTGIVNTYLITGVISGITSGSVKIRLYDNTVGNILVDSTYASPTNYVYTFNNVPGLKNYLIVPEFTDYAFNPNNIALLNMIGNKYDQNFAATKALGPILRKPDNAGQNIALSPTFIWDPPSIGATPTNYKIQVALSSDFTNGLMEHSENVTTYSGFSLTSATTYFWRVQSQSITGNNWSEVWSFTTILSSPTLNTPVCGSTTSINPTLTWNVVPLATKYDVELENMTTSVSTVYNDLTATNINVTGLVNFTNYQWRVRAKNSGSTSLWSSWCSFSTDASIPALKSPISGAVGQPLSVNFQWFQVTGATTYTLDYSTNPNFTAGTTTSIDVNGLNQIVNNLTMNSTYFWRVKVKAPVSSNYSEVWYFNVGGAFSWTPANIDFGNILAGKATSQKVTVTNNGSTPIRVYLHIEGNQFNTPNEAENPIDISAGSIKEITVNFAPTSTGLKSGKLQIQHNVSSQPLNPVEIPLTGTGISTFATLNLPSVIDFGTVIFNSGSRDTTIMLYNNSTVPGDYLYVSEAAFETTNSIFQIIASFPIVLDQGTSYPVKLRFNPNALGIQINNMHILNSSSNAPDAKIQIRGNVLQGDLVVTPAYVDFGNTTKAVPYKDTTVAIQNNSSQPITLTSKFLIGDTSSYTIDNPTQITLQPNQTDYVKVRFFPRTAGRKTAVFNINSNYSLAPALYVPLTGIGGEEPVIYADMQTIDFGVLRNGQTKDTSLTLRNDGSLDLNISSKEFIGTDKTIFSFVNNGSPVVLRGGESKVVTLRATGILPIGQKTAQLKLVSNDPTNGTYLINLLATVRSSIIFKSAEKIIFDTINVGYSADSTFFLRNDGDLNATITKMVLDGPFESDFKILNVTTPIELAPKEVKSFSIRFSPSGIGMRYAQIMISVNDPSDPEQRIIVQGWGKQASADPIFIVDGNPNGSPEIDFGRVPIFETRTKEIDLKNLSKYGKLRIDAMYIDSIYKQPFGYGNLKFPIYIKPGDFMPLVLSFYPNDKVKTYGAFLYIQYSDSTLTPNKNNVIKVKMTGAVIFPGMEFELTPVLKFGQVINGQSLKKEFVIDNQGETYLIIDSMVVSGADAKEFTVNDKTPIRIEKDISYTCSVTFKASKVGSKDVKISVYSNDLFKLGDIEIWAECIASSGQTTGITKMDEIPTTYNLQQNYPNPFNPSTKIEYSIPEASHVTVKVFNSLGQEVAVLVNEAQQIGKYIIDWQPKNLPSGIYFYKMQSSKFSSFKKMVLLK